MVDGRAEVRIRGGRELRRRLRQAGQDMTELKAANREAAEIVTAAAIARSPTGTGATGRKKRRRLKETVRAQASATSGRVKVGGAANPYAGPIHFGWPARNIQANPFVSEAAQKKEPVWLRLYEAHIEKILSSISGDITHDN